MPDLKVLVVEDEDQLRNLHSKFVVSEGFYNISVAADGVEALEMLKKEPFDIMLLDYNMPRKNGNATAREALELFPQLTVIMVTAHDVLDDALELMRIGVYDFLTKPVDYKLLSACLKRATERVYTRRELTGTRTVIEALMRVLEAKDTYLNGHSRRVAAIARKIAERMNLSEWDCKIIEYAGMLHDVGKVAISELILNKSTSLSTDEYSEIKKHVQISKDIISPVGFLSEAAKFVFCHHERLDGSGYPSGLKGDDIPLGARIIAVADTYDAMTSDRAYRSRKGKKIVEDELLRVSGKQLDTSVTKLLIQMLSEEKNSTTLPEL